MFLSGFLLRVGCWASLSLPLLVSGIVVACGGAANAEAQTPESASGNDPGEPPSCSGLADCERACSGGDASGCELAGRMYETGEDAPQDYDKAAKLYDQACAGGREEACAHLAMMYDIGLAVGEDPKRAEELYRKACEAGNRWACKRGDQLEQ